MDEQEYDRLSNTGKVMHWAEFVAGKVKRLGEENEALRECVKRALTYRPLPTDPFQEYVKQRCPYILEEWNDERSKTPS